MFTIVLSICFSRGVRTYFIGRTQRKHVESTLVPFFNERVDVSRIAELLKELHISFWRHLGNNNVTTATSPQQRHHGNLTHRCHLLLLLSTILFNFSLLWTCNIYIQGVSGQEYMYIIWVELLIGWFYTNKDFQLFPEHHRCGGENQ